MSLTTGWNTWNVRGVLSHVRLLEGCARRDGERLILANESASVTVRASGRHRDQEPAMEISAPYLLVALDQPVAVASTQATREQTVAVIARCRFNRDV
jgi:hypothetical protein